MIKIEKVISNIKNALSDKDSSIILKRLGDGRIQIEIPVSVNYDFTIGYVDSSDGTTLAELKWIYSSRQVVLISTADKESLTGNSFIFYMHGYAGTLIDAIQPTGASFWYATNGQMVTFCNTPNQINNANDIGRNGYQMFVDNCNISDGTFTKTASFDMSLMFIGMPNTGSNILMLQSDAIA